MNLFCVWIFLTSASSAPVLPDQKRWEHTATPRHWSGFFSSLDAANAHCVFNGSWFSSPKQDICSSVPMISVMAASWALLSLISSSYSEKACRMTKNTFVFKGESGVMSQVTLKHATPHKCSFRSIKNQSQTAKQFSNCKICFLILLFFFSLPGYFNVFPNGANTCCYSHCMLSHFPLVSGLSEATVKVFNVKRKLTKIFFPREVQPQSSLLLLLCVI